MWIVFFFKPKTAYELRISDWSSDVCSSDLVDGAAPCRFRRDRVVGLQAPQIVPQADSGTEQDRHDGNMQAVDKAGRSEEHTSELQSLMRISYAVFCLKKKNNNH